MKILLDHNIPHALRSHFPEECEVHTAQYKGWEDYSDDEILTAAEEEGYGVFVTLDTSLPDQQNFEELTISLIVMDVHPAIPDELKDRMNDVNTVLLEATGKGVVFEIC